MCIPFFFKKKGGTKKDMVGKKNATLVPTNTIQKYT